MTAVALLAMFVMSACDSGSRSSELSESQRRAIADTIRTFMVTAYDLSDSSKVVERLMSLYPTSGRVISATAGRVTTERDSLEGAVSAFWTNVGQYMRGPKWEWGEMEIDVLSVDAAAVTATYTIPHHTPDGAPHVLGGVWTSVWGRRDGSWRIVQEHLSDMPRPLAEALERKMRPSSDSSRSH
jgi:ketosteroid isomerase-like protein